MKTENINWKLYVNKNVDSINYTPKLKMDHMTRQSWKFPLRRHLDCENQLRIAKVMIFVITGNELK